MQATRYRAGKRKLPADHWLPESVSRTLAIVGHLVCSEGLAVMLTPGRTLSTMRRGTSLAAKYFLDEPGRGRFFESRVPEDDRPVPGQTLSFVVATVPYEPHRKDDAP
jgi:hypothetical protein